MSKCLSLIRERFCNIFSPAVLKIRSDVAEVVSYSRYFWASLDNPGLYGITEERNRGIKILGI